VAAGRAEAAAEVHELEVDAAPVLAREEGLQVALRLRDAAPAREAPARRQAVDVRVHREGRLAEGLHHHDARRLVADTGECLEQREVRRHAPLVLVQQALREPREGAGLLGRQPAAPDQALDLGDGEARQRLRRRRGGEERRRHLVDPRVGALGREHHRDEQREGVRVAQRHHGLGVQAVEELRDALGLLRPPHAVSRTFPKFLRSWM
jgi:hypothetical protein